MTPCFWFKGTTRIYKTVGGAGQAFYNFKHASHQNYGIFTNNIEMKHCIHLDWR